MRVRIPKMALVAALLALGACQEPDVGQACTLTWGTSPDSPPPPTPVELFQSGGGEWFETGNSQCEDFVCIVSPEPPGAKYSTSGYCSKPCVSNADCFESKTGLVCRQIVLDPLFLAQLDKLDPTVKQQYLSDQAFSSYCAVPR